jgi:hypothetical protein
LRIRHTDDAPEIVELHVARLLRQAGYRKKADQDQASAKCISLHGSPR